MASSLPNDTETGTTSRTVRAGEEHPPITCVTVLRNGKDVPLFKLTNESLRELEASGLVPHPRPLFRNWESLRNSAREMWQDKSGSEREAFEAEMMWLPVAQICDVVNRDTGRFTLTTECLDRSTRLINGQGHLGDSQEDILLRSSAQNSLEAMRWISTGKEPEEEKSKSMHSGITAVHGCWSVHFVPS
jgi:hypothetical protein